MKTIETTCFFTGHRDIPNERYDAIFERVYSVIEELYKKGFRTFIAGGAIGFDTLAAIAVLRLREKYSDVYLHICIPCRDQSKNFSQIQKEKYMYVVNNADSYEVMYEHYVRGCMHARNKKMADFSSVCVAYCKKQTGGTAFTVNYAQKKGIEIIYID